MDKITEISRMDIIRMGSVTLLWAICYPLIRTGLDSAPPLHFASLRSLIAGIILVLLGFGYRYPLPAKQLTWLTLAAIGLFAATFGFLGMFLAGGVISPGLATVLANIQPFIAAIIGFFFLDERPSRQTGVALILGFMGIVVISFTSFMPGTVNTTPMGIFYVLVGAVGVAIGNVLLKHCADHVNPVVAVGWSFIFGALPLYIIAWLIEPAAVITWSMSFIISLVILSVFGTAMVYVLWLDLLSRNDLVRLNTWTFLVPVIGLIIGALYFHERLTGIQWIGSIIIILSVIVVSCPIQIFNGKYEP